MNTLFSVGRYLYLYIEDQVPLELFCLLLLDFVETKTDTAQSKHDDLTKIQTLLKAGEEVQHNLLELGVGCF